MNINQSHFRNETSHLGHFSCLCHVNVILHVMFTQMAPLDFLAQDGFKAPCENNFYHNVGQKILAQNVRSVPITTQFSIFKDLKWPEWLIRRLAHWMLILKCHGERYWKPKLPSVAVCVFVRDKKEHLKDRLKKLNIKPCLNRWRWLRV